MAMRVLSSSSLGDALLTGDRRIALVMMGVNAAGEVRGTSGVTAVSRHMRRSLTIRRGSSLLRVASEAVRFGSGSDGGDVGACGPTWSRLRRSSR